LPTGCEKIKDTKKTKHYGEKEQKYMNNFVSDLEDISIKK